MAEGLRSKKVGAQASVRATIIVSTTMRVVAVVIPLPCITIGTSASIKGVTHVTVAAKTPMH